MGQGSEFEAVDVVIFAEAFGVDETRVVVHDACKGPFGS
jgi:hypothetical protein